MRSVALVLVGLLVVSAPAQGAPDAATDCLGAPPCGYILPLIDLDFPELPRCSPLSGLADPDECQELPDRGGSFSHEGTLRWYWSVSEDGTYPGDPQQDIVITFPGVATNPSWLTFEVEPATITITAVDLADPTRLVTKEGSGGQSTVWYEHVTPITLTVARHGDPGPEDIGLLESRNGIQALFVKAKSTASGETFKEGFGLEQVGMNARADPDVASEVDDKKSPLPFIVPALVFAASARRRRQG